MRVMRVLTRPNVGGPTLQAVALWHAHAALGVRTLLVVGTCGPEESAIDLAAHGLPRIELADVDEGSTGFVVVPGLSNRWSLFGRGRVVRTLADLARGWRADVVHTHTSTAGWLGRKAAFRAGVRTVVHTFHGLVLRDYFAAPMAWAIARLERRFAARTTRLVAVSESCREELDELGVVARERVTVVPPAVPLPTFLSRHEARHRLSIHDAFAVATYGRLVPIKRVDHVLSAVAPMAGTKTFVCGGGPLHERLRRQAASSVTFVGGGEASRAWLPAFDAMVLASRREGFPLAAVEAFAAGVPTVGYDVPGVRDALADGRGLLVPERQGPAGLRAALERLRREPELARELATAARALVPRTDPAVVAARLLAIYRGEA